MLLLLHQRYLYTGVHYVCVGDRHLGNQCPETSHKRVYTMASPRQQTVPNGRNTNGTFAPGNPGGSGNPHARKVAQLRTAILDCLNTEAMASIVNGLLIAAQSGDVQAAKLLLSYAVGRPPDPVNPDRLDVDEWELLKAQPTPLDRVLQEAAQGVNNPRR